MTNTSETKDRPSGRWPIRIDKKFWNADKIISLSAFVVSIATLLALMYQIRLSGEQNELAQRQQELVRKQQYASVLPYLELQTGTNVGDRLFEFLLYNNGVGPAFIEEVRIIYDGQEYPGDLLNFYRAVVLGEEDTVVLDLGTQGIYEGNLIPAGREISMLSAYAYASSLKVKRPALQMVRTPDEGPRVGPGRDYLLLRVRRTLDRQRDRCCPGIATRRGC